MVSLQKTIDCFVTQGFGPFLGVPDSILKPFVNRVIEHKGLDYLATNNEGEAVAIASGTYLAGKKPVVMLQNSGLGNAVNPLTSLNYIFCIPILLIITWRGEPGFKDAPQHQLMGKITLDMLTLLHIEYDFFPETEDEIAPKIQKATQYIDTINLPFAFILRKGVLDNHNLPPSSRKISVGDTLIPPTESSGERLSRWEVITTIASEVDNRAFLIATTGKTGRELFTYKDSATQFYMIGSMGCASSLGLGIALYQPAAPIIVLDGDGAVLMRLEAMVSVGHYQPANLIHIVLDNESYDSTGGQYTLSAGVCFPEMAAACGYKTVISVISKTKLLAALKFALANDGPHLIHIKIQPGSVPQLGRPTLSPPEIASRFRQEVHRYA